MDKNCGHCKWIRQAANCCVCRHPNISNDDGHYDYVHWNYSCGRFEKREPLTGLKKKLHDKFGTCFPFKSV